MKLPPRLLRLKKNGLFKRSLTILFLLPVLYYLTGTGLTLHFCGDKIADVSLYGNTHCPCKEKSGKGNPCCSDVVIYPDKSPYLATHTSINSIKNSVFQGEHVATHSINELFLWEGVPLDIRDKPPGFLLPLFIVLGVFRC